MKILAILIVIGVLGGCKYFSYQEGCTDDPDRVECDGSHQAEHRK